MSKASKYEIKVSPKGDTWEAKILRRVSVRRTQVSKKKAGFDSQEAAQAWADTNLEDFINKQQERNLRKTEKRSQAEIAAQAKEEAQQKADDEYRERLAAQDLEDDADE